MRITAIFMKSHVNPIIAGFAVFAAVLVLPYLLLPSQDGLNRNDIERIAEFQHLRQTLGNAVWPGFGKAQIPFAMTKGEREYLFDYPSPLNGSTSVHIRQYPGPVVYRKGHTVPRLAMTAGPVDGVPAAIMPDKATFDQVISLMQSASDGSMLEATMSGGAGIDATTYILVAIHESFHAFQYKQGMNRIQNAFDLPPGSLDEKLFISRLREAEAIMGIRNMLNTESRHLAQALSADRPTLCLEEARLFLRARDNRRLATAEKGAGLTVASIAANENGIEWIEGMTAYVQSRMLELASAKAYKPLDLMYEVPGFHGYNQTSGSNKLSLDRSAAMSYQMRSYAVGAGICSLLDRLGAEWKKTAIEELKPPTELLRQALENRSEPEQNSKWTPRSRRSY
jgi:hypothetical protein